MNAAEFDAKRYGVIGVAVSGGMDSMCLLHYLAQAGAPLVALTVEHGIRGEEALADVRLVRDYCHTLGVACEVRHVDAPAYAAARHVGLEQAARELRHAFFAEMRAQGRVDCIATAHHLDDQAETVLLHLLRGSGLGGLCGIAEREGYIRPFLGYTRADIGRYAARYGVPYREDATNRDTAYNRNYLRHEVLPRVEERFPAYRESLARFARVAAQEVDLLDSLSVPPVVQHGVVYLPLEAFRHHPALAKWSVRRAMAHFDHGVDCEAANLEDVLALAEGVNNKAVCLPHGVRAALEYDRVAFWRPSSEYAVYPFGEGKFAFGEITVCVRPYRTGDRLRFDLDRVPAGAVLRLRREGDIIAKFGGGTKSLGDYYTDKKVPLRVRDSYPVVAVEQHILVCWADISRDVAVTDGTRRIYTITQEE